MMNKKEPVQTVYNPHQIEKEMQEFWKKNKVPEQIVKMNWKRQKFYLLDGPPYVNGTPHVGHVKTTVFKDLWGRLKYMQGFAVWFQPGFDCGGLPIESAVEKKLGIKSKGDIEKMGVDKFIAECQALAKGNEHVWIDFYKKIGAWRGWLPPYLTSENYFIESGWWTVKQWFEKGMFVEGTKPGFWCTHCETVLAGIESSESYKNMEDPSIFIKFRLKGPKEYFLVWTTTPWTLPANVALAVHPEEAYVRIQSGSEIYILAEKLLKEADRLVAEGALQPYSIVEKFPGKDLAGMSYEPLLDTPSQSSLNEKAHRVYMSVPILKKRVASKAIAKGAEEEDEFGQFVTMDAGTGIVHVAPGHGDAKFGEHYGLPFLSPVDEKGLFTEDAGKYRGIYVKKADSMIISDLKSNGKLISESRITHSYPLCWRCKTPLIFRMSRQWFLKLDLIKEKIIKANRHIKWLPEFGRERYRNTIETAPDWAVTRQRYWGIPLPIWNCRCGTRKVIGSAKELSELSLDFTPDNSDLHKNTLDKIKIKCMCGDVMEREKDVMDVWFDSGITPWASLGYPYKNRKLFEKLWTVDLVNESQDQVKAWFDKLMLCGFATFDTQPFSTVCMNGWTLDEKGEKMSKSLGNVVSADDAYKALGADTLRLYVCQDTAPWETQKFSLRSAKDSGRSLNTLWNAYNYYKTYFSAPAQKHLPMHKEDRWILSRINSTIKAVSECLEKFEFHAASRCLTDFIVNDFSRTYVKLIRGRLDNSVSFAMSYVFDRICKLLAPICPFISDYIYCNANKKSVHHENWPVADKEMVSEKLENDMKTALLITEAANSLRKEKQIKLKWPLACLYIAGEMCKGPAVHMEEMLKSMCNVKDVRYVEKDEMLLNILEKDSVVKKEFEGGVVCIDTNITEDLKKEALLRELTRAVQEKRKENGLQIGNRIHLTIESDFQGYLKENENTTKERIGADKITYSRVSKETGSVKIGNIKARFFFELSK